MAYFFCKDGDGVKSSCHSVITAVTKVIWSLDLRNVLKGAYCEALLTEVAASCMPLTNEICRETTAFLTADLILQPFPALMLQHKYCNESEMQIALPGWSAYTLLRVFQNQPALSFQKGTVDIKLAATCFLNPWSQ